MVQKKSYEQFCPIARTLDIFGDRWTIIILRDLFFGRSRFNDLLEHSPGMPPKVLSDRLKRLTEIGYVERTVYSQHPLRAEYLLTDRGLTFFPVMEAMLEWGLQEFYAGDPDAQALVRTEVRTAARKYPQLSRRKVAKNGS